MNHNRVCGRLWIWLVVVILTLSACSPEIPIALPGTPTHNVSLPTATALLPTASPTPPPSDTPLPSPTLTPTPELPTPIPTEAPQASASRLGVALEGFYDEAGWQPALALGVHWAWRWQPIDWRAVEPAEGEYHWETLASLEEELFRAREAGVEPILSLQYAPPWAQKRPPSACGPIRPDKLEAFASFVEQLIMRYGPSTPYGVRYWRIGNELDVAPDEIGPDSIFGCWGDLDDPDYGGGYYAEMLKAVYGRAKLANPLVQIMLGGLLLECDPDTTVVGETCINQRRWSSGRFLEGVLRAGGGDYFDVVDVHSYAHLEAIPARMRSFYAWSGPAGGTGLPEKVAFVRRVLSQYGYDKPILAGEIALKCDEPTPECYDAAAAFIPRVYAEAYDLNLLGAVYFALISDFKYKGLLLPDFTPRPMYGAYQFLGQQLAGAQPEGPVADYAGLSGYSFIRPDGWRVQIVWATSGTDQTLPLPTGFAQAFDKFGAPLAPVEGTLTIGWSPIYVELQP